MPSHPRVNRDICRRYCSSSHGQWSWHCFTETTNQPRRNKAWIKKWRIKANEFKSVHVTFTTRRETCPPVHINSVHLPQQEDVEYLGLHLDRRLNRRKHITTKRKQLGMTLTKMHWLLGRKSKLSTSNKVLIYKAMPKPVWTYGIQLWGTASTSNTEILERPRYKVLRKIVDAPWYVPNTVIWSDPKTPTVKKEILHDSSQYSSRLSVHSNDLVVDLIAQPDNRRLRRHMSNYLPTIFWLYLYYL
jgi:hypothetical protein